MNDNQQRSTQLQTLSESHHQMLASAVEKGYFKIPRETTLVELATKEGVTDVKASERLREGVEIAVCTYLAEVANETDRDSKHATSECSEEFGTE